MFRLSVTPEQAGALADELSRVVDVGLEHATIVAPIAAGLTGMTPYLAQEYVTGETLDVAMRQYAPGPLETTLPFITQLASALDYACAAGVSHGALHPRDVFLTPELARATGFGVVAALERVGVRGPVRRPYSAPERIAGEPWGPAADIFSLAAIAFELLTGRRPAGTGGTGEQVVALLGEIGGTADQPAFRRAFATALADDPAERYGSAEEFAHALAVAAGIEEPVAPGVAASEQGPLEQTEERWAETLSPLSDDQVDEPVPADVDRELPVPTAPFELQSAAAEPSLFEGIEEIDELAEAPEVAAEARTPVEEGSVEDEAEAEEAEAENDSEIDQWPIEEPAATSAEFAESDQDYRFSRSAVGMQQPASREWPRRALLPLALTLAVVILVAFVANFGLDTPDAVPLPPASAGQELPVSPAADIVLPSPSESNLASPASSAGQKSSGGTAVEVLDDLRVVPVPLAASPVPPAIPSPAPAVAPPSPLASPPAPAPPQPSPGRLLVRSSPPGALVDVNGAPRGTTPLALSEIPYGSYTLRVSRPGYVSQVHELSISAGQPVGAVSVGLMPAAPGAASPARAAGSVFVESRPPAAQVFLDGERVGRTPVLLSDVGAGLHEIRIQRDGYRVWSTTTRVVASERTRVGASLDRTARP